MLLCWFLQHFMAIRKSRLPLFVLIKVQKRTKQKKKNKTRWNKREKNQNHKNKNKITTTKREIVEKERKPTICDKNKVFFWNSWLILCPFNDYIWARGNICQDNVGLFTYKMHILVVITLLDFQKPYLKLTCYHGKRLPVLTEGTELRLPLWMAFLNSLHHSACIPVISRKLRIGSTVEWGSSVSLHCFITKQPASAIKFPEQS